ncbi:Fe-S cluster assembly sulfur transfer protein SufU [Glaciecola siphonariae]|uniref:Fe-S cluster assembly sulfur transfer protein SufU n=1 Tax=Glaciecola siphonariae TaxID=521012 RepID=A0ABV9LXL7_9ALTE
MSQTQIYKAHLLDHFKKPRNKASHDLLGMQVVKRGSNPRCGDDIEIGFNISANSIEAILFRGRGCAVCIASASMMTEAVHGQSIDDAKRIALSVAQWIEGEHAEVPALLKPVDAVRHHPARKKCLMLAWNALLEGLEVSAS